MSHGQIAFLHPTTYIPYSGRQLEETAKTWVRIPDGSYTESPQPDSLSGIGVMSVIGNSPNLGLYAGRFMHGIPLYRIKWDSYTGSPYTGEKS